MKKKFSLNNQNAFLALYYFNVSVKALLYKLKYYTEIPF